MEDMQRVLDGLEEITGYSCEQMSLFDNDVFIRGIAQDALELLKESKKIIDMYHKADSFLEAHGWKWETIIADSTNPDKKDGEQGMKDRPMVRHGIFDKKNWWYVCPYCNEPIDYQVQKCRWCHKEINWEIEDGEQECR